MNLVSRYVEEVKRHLPPATRDEIARELALQIEGELQAERKELNREPNENEVVEILLRHGHPLKVASAYQPRRALVSETAYPLYKRATAWVLSIYLLFDIALGLFRLSRNSGAWPVMLFPAFLHSTVDTLLFGFLLVTAIFHYFGDSLTANPFFWRWDPRKLPVLSASWANVPLVGTFISIISLVFFAALLTSGKYEFANADFSFQLDYRVASYMLVLRLPIVLIMAVYMVNLFQRYWTRLKLYLVSAAGVLSALLLLRIAFVRQILHIVIHQPGAGSGQTAADRWVGWWPNLNVHVICILIAALLLYRCTRFLTRAFQAQVPAF